MKEDIVEVITDFCLFGLPLDLLYLYYAGGWDEPIRVILYAELALLYSLPSFAAWRFFRYIRKKNRR